MVKGTQKQMVVVKTAGNRYYEEAHFVLRDGQRLTDEAEPTMLAEANRILDECMRTPRRRRMRRVTAFFVGLVLGAALALAVALPALL
ncbi:MAG: hypothetical protein J6R04_07900 [Clostridia bacterium]|nr:hypothetical protein [Clostridia bacterium]